MRDHDKNTPRGCIWKIDRYAIHDGPGIRTSFYFKGCPLHCLWCANPEGQSPQRELGFLEERCTHCGSCYHSCPSGALRVMRDVPVIDYLKCDVCEKCVSSCRVNALISYGVYYEIHQLLDIIERDRHAFRKTGGGITCTGGEPLHQPDFLKALFSQCQSRGIHTVLETSGYAEASTFREILNHVDWLFFDLKHLDNSQHLKLTGQSNAIILNNLQIASDILGKKGRSLVIRQVIVPGLNDGENTDSLIQLATRLPHVDMIELLPYHSYGSCKYKALGKNYRLDDVFPPSKDYLLNVKNAIRKAGITCTIGGL